MNQTQKNSTTLLASGLAAAALLVGPLGGVFAHGQDRTGDHANTVSAAPVTAPAATLGRQPSAFVAEPPSVHVRRRASIGQTYVQREIVVIATYASAASSTTADLKVETATHESVAPRVCEPVDYLAARHRPDTSELNVLEKLLVRSERSGAQHRKGSHQGGRAGRTQPLGCVSVGAKPSRIVSTARYKQIVRAAKRHDDTDTGHHCG